ncbi:kinase-like protein [Penicillium concentricum]|uniref:Kinase-like protein n=1 Tax=Penicillium concentricum TaxID=293559 RepID=A0A9W9RIQ4_9EURO|nr:kinase-like protein [Penicillium concentricum]KAJ5360886.1 kinase-like protein [Penicillium concentricum]
MVSVQIDNNADPSPVLNEINMLQLRYKDHPGLDFTRLASDIFETESLSGRHYCIAYKPQGNSVRTLQETFPNAMIPKALVKALIHRLFFSMNWLEFDDDYSLQDIEDQESQDPSLPITSTTNGTLLIIVYKSRPTILELSGHPILTDYGQMRLIEGCVNQDWWMSDIYRAPEKLIPKTSLGDFVTTIPPGQEKDQFLRFIRKILTWDPEVRATSNEIIPDEWLMRPVEEML